jgi:hypothetical protein
VVSAINKAHLLGSRDEVMRLMLWPQLWRRDEAPCFIGRRGMPCQKVWLGENHYLQMTH